MSKNLIFNIAVSLLIVSTLFLQNATCVKAAASIYKAETINRNGKTYLTIIEGQEKIYEKEIYHNGKTKIIIPEGNKELKPLASPKSTHLTDKQLTSTPNFIVELCDHKQHYTYYFFHVSNKADNLAVISTGATGLTPSYLDKEERYSLLGLSYFSDWGASMPEAEVSLGWQNKKLCILPEDLPSKDEIKRLQEVIAQQFETLEPSKLIINQAPPELAEQVFRLYYSGHKKFAKRFFNQSWPKNHPGKSKYWSFLMHSLNKQPLWKAINRKFLSS
jgi:hypothetical protein